MSFQDGLLTFQIKETVFLTADKAGIGDVKELELLPDVEIIETERDLSIVGCLRLHGTYEAVAAEHDEAAEGEAGMLVQAVQFSPFPLDREGADPTFAQAEEGGFMHRIPLNITIPRERIAELGDIYAVVDQFDYELKSPRELRVQGVLKLTGIRLDERLEPKESAWEFLHVANMPADPEFPPTSLDEIERRLADLEREVEAEYTRPQEEVTSPYNPADAESGWHTAGEWDQGPSDPMQEAVPSAYYRVHGEPSPDADGAWGERAHFVPEDVREESGWAVESAADDEAEESASARGTGPEAEPTGESSNLIDFQAALDERQAERSAAEDGEYLEREGAEQDAEAESALADMDEVAEADAPVAGEAEPEVRVAITSKPNQEREEPLHLSSLFANAGRIFSEQMAAEKQAESSSSSSAAGRALADDESYRQGLEVLNTLTSFVRNGEEQFSKLKMCIAQRHDTLEKIAERYALPVTRLMEVNQLSSDRLEEGQVLYIPL